jgi:hypothetical protein
LLLFSEVSSLARGTTSCLLLRSSRLLNTV